MPNWGGQIGLRLTTFPGGIVDVSPGAVNVTYIKTVINNGSRESSLSSFSYWYESSGGGYQDIFFKLTEEFLPLPTTTAYDDYFNGARFSSNFKLNFSTIDQNATGKWFVYFDRVGGIPEPTT
ncbi:hypothetical protein [Sphingomonas lycopersici]|uniref:Uncharacterized protein n=1 Tax=Sphingomonas lycopersici TaxID=2951807 RepID=A0AA41Z7W3_9SPHN|nr:hypothetical protein [Sphingomonas lycopersici]MCW6534256.1 hypothetical protein [Sphingomonas lycopersici]